MFQRLTFSQLLPWLFDEFWNWKILTFLRWNKMVPKWMWMTDIINQHYVFLMFRWFFLNHIFFLTGNFMVHNLLVHKIFAYPDCEMSKLHRSGTSDEFSGLTNSSNQFSRSWGSQFSFAIFQEGSETGFGVGWKLKISYSE